MARIDRPRRLGLLRRLIRAEGGAEAIEFALVSIPLFLFLLGVIEFARLYWTQSELQYAAEAAARCATLNCCGNNCGTSGAGRLKDYTVSQLLGMSVPSGSLSNFQLNARACGNQVSFTYSFNFIVGALFPRAGVTLSASACHQA